MGRTVGLVRTRTGTRPHTRSTPPPPPPPPPQPWSNGQVFTTGASADGIDEYAQIARPHPALRGQINIFATTQGWETFFIGGAYREALIDGWLKDTVPTQYADLDAFVRQEEQPGTAWWQVRSGAARRTPRARTSQRK